jgi:hypothetical protein
MSLLNSLIPASRLAAVEAALLQAFGSTAVTDISLVSGGLSGSYVYKLNQQYVLKLNETPLSEPLTLAADAGIAPTLYYAANGVYISEYIHNRPIRSAFLPDKLIVELAGAIKAIHAIPYNTVGNDLQRTIATMIDNFKRTNILSGQVFDECFQQYEIINSKYPWQDTNKVFSHNDLNPGNILCDGEKVWIVDWDVASLNDRYVDLANVANFFVHTDEQEKSFLQIYFDNVDEYKTARFYIMRQVCRIIYAMLMFQLAAQGKPADYAHNQEMEGISLRDFGALMAAGKISLATYEGQLMFGKALLNEAVAQMRVPRFITSLSQL